MNKIIYTSLLLLLLPFLTYGQETTNPGQESITLDKCREMALENNRQITIAEYNREKAELTAKSLKTNYLPKLSASGGGYYGNTSTDLTIHIDDINLFDPSILAGLQGILPPEYIQLIGEMSTVSIPDMNFNLKLGNTYMAGVNIEQPIYTGGKITSAYKMSKIGEEVADLQIEMTRSEIILETDKAYWQCIQALELYKSATKYKEVVEEFHRTVFNATEVGLKSNNDLMKVEVQLNNAELQLRRCENGIRLSQMLLCHITGLPLQTSLIFPEAFEGNDVLINYRADIFSRPEYSILNKQVELKTQEKRFVQSDFLPNVGIKGSYNYLNGIRLNGEVLMNKGSFSAMFMVNIPIFHWGEGSKKIKAAESERQIAQLQLDELSEKMNLELEQVLNKYNETLLEVTLTERSLKQSEENLRMSRDHYEAGMETISEYLEAQTIWQQAQTEHIVARTRLEICKTEYLKAIGASSPFPSLP